MKLKIPILFFSFFACTGLSGLIAQNIGIGHTKAEGLLDVNGDLVLRSANITLENGTTLSVNVENNPYSNYRISGPTDDFTIAGISFSPDGKLLSFYNRSGFTMNIAHENVNAKPKERIHTGTGYNIAIPDKASISFIYDGGAQRWVVRSNSAPGAWVVSQNRIFNTHTGNVGIGTQNPFYKLMVQGDGYFQGNNTHITMQSIQGSNFISAGGLQIASPNTDNHPAGIKNNILAINGNQIQSYVHDIDDPTVSDYPDPLVLNPLGGTVGIGTNYFPGFAKLEIAVSPESRAISTGDGIVGMVHFLGGANRSPNSLGGYFGTSTNHPLHFYTASQWAQATLLPNGNLGIGTTAPVSKLDVQGSLSLPIRTVKPNIPFGTVQQIIIDQNDFTLYIDADNISGTLNVLLPAPASCKGRLYIIKAEKMGSNKPILVYNGATLEFTGYYLESLVSSSPSSWSEGETSSITLQSTGEKWIEIDRDHYYYKYLR